MPKKLLYITNAVSGPGGLERVLSIKLHYLIEHFGYEVHVLTLNQESSEFFYKFNKSITYHNIVATGTLMYIFNYATALRKLVKKIDPDLISVCDDGLKAFLLPLVLNKTRPLVYERHASKRIFLNEENPNLFSKFKFKLSNAIMDFGAKYYDAFVVLTKTNLNEWNLKNALVIPNPLSFYPKAKSTLRNKTVITVGNHGFQKGFDRLLHSWKSVITKHPDWHLEIYGKIDMEQKYIKLAKRLDLLQNVSFFNPVKDIYNKYNESSIFAMSSRSEGFGMVLIEAMAYGLPCVSFDCPCGPSDIITQNEDGFLIKNGDIQSFSNALLDLIENEEKRRVMGFAARNNVKRYLPENIVPKWDELFMKLTLN